MPDFYDLYKDCTLCPRNCSVDRLKGALGLCGTGPVAVVASAVLHKGEEPPVSGNNGSGAVFFSGCGLKCPFCQNIQLSRGTHGRHFDSGREVSVSELAEIFLGLEAAGAANINLVTATHITPSVIDAVTEAKRQGLSLPVVWNSSGYERTDAIKLLEGIVDIWLPDLKTLDPELSFSFFRDRHYPDYAREALKMMADLLEKSGGTELSDGLLKKGMIVRHLVIPGYADLSREVIRWFSENLKDRAMLSVMVQYTEADSVRSVTEVEYDRLLDWLEEFGVEEGFMQDLSSSDSAWIPDFDRRNPFPEEYSVPVWYWKD